MESTYVLKICVPHPLVSAARHALSEIMAVHRNDKIAAASDTKRLIGGACIAGWVVSSSVLVRECSPKWNMLGSLRDQRCSLKRPSESSWNLQCKECVEPASYKGG